MKIALRNVTVKMVLLVPRKPASANVRLDGKDYNAIVLATTIIMVFNAMKSVLAKMEALVIQLTAIALAEQALQDRTAKINASKVILVLIANRFVIVKKATIPDAILKRENAFANPNGKEFDVNPIVRQANTDRNVIKSAIVKITPPAIRRVVNVIVLPDGKETIAVNLAILVITALGAGRNAPRSH